MKNGNVHFQEIVPGKSGSDESAPPISPNHISTWSIHFPKVFSKLYNIFPREIGLFQAPIIQHTLSFRQNFIQH